MAIVAEKQTYKNTIIVGVGRYDLIENTSTAEISFLVDDIDQGKGICTQLLNDLTEIAREKGITTFIGILTNENVIMLDILKKFNTNLILDIEGGDIIITFDI